MYCVLSSTIYTLLSLETVHLQVDIVLVFITVLIVFNEFAPNLGNENEFVGF